jgi:hypothetical protein
MKLFNFVDRREIDEWRDQYTLAAAATLNGFAIDMLASFEDELKTASWTDGLLAQNSFVATRIAPRLQHEAAPVLEHIVAGANKALQRIVDHQAIWHYEPSITDRPEAFEGWEDVAVAVGPLAGGVVAAAALPAMAVTTSTVFFGLITTTAISWPVVVGGGALAAVGVATGAINTAKIWDKTEARLRRKVRDHVVSVLLAGRQGAPSILDELRRVLGEAAAKAKKL